MVRVKNVDESLHFYCTLLGLKEVRRKESEKGRFTLIFLSDATPETAFIELTYNWDPETYEGGRNFGHLCFEVDHIYETCKTLMDADVVMHRPPRDGYMAFVKSPDGVSVELLQKGERLALEEPWSSMSNIGTW